MSTEEDDFQDALKRIKGKQERDDGGSQAAGRTPCRHGAKCWDHTAAHRARFSHPPARDDQPSSPPTPATSSASHGKRAAESESRPAAAGGSGGSQPVKQASLLGWISVKRKPEEPPARLQQTETVSEKRAKPEKTPPKPQPAPPPQEPPRRASRVSSDMVDLAVEDPEKTTLFPSEMEEIPIELEARMRAQIQRLEGGGSGAWMDAEDTRPPPPMAIDADLPVQYQDAWDDTHVRLPCSPRNTYRKKQNLDKELSRWYLIQTSLTDGISSSTELHEAILSYHTRAAGSWDFSGMHSFFNEIISKEEQSLFFSSLLPRIVYLAFQLPTLCYRPIPLLVPGQELTVMLSQMQIASLLANAFLCTFPRQGPRASASGEAVVSDAAYQNINMHTLWTTPHGGHLPPNQAAKVRCLLHYFDRVTRNNPGGKVSFQRLQLPAVRTPDWSNSTTLLSPITVHADGLIEDEAGAVQIDFANKMIGGGVLGRGCIQEEIRFVINPELLVSLLFTAQMGDREAVVILGAERFSAYRGYGKTFEFAGPFVDKTAVDGQGRRQTEVVAVDALYYGSSHRTRMQQWTDESVERELNKFYAGIQNRDQRDPALLPAVATGNWGCGNFGGFHDLKALVQWMSASETGRPLIYFTFGEPGLAQQLRELAALLVQKSVTVGTLRRVMKSISEQLYKEGGEGDAAAMPQLFNVLFDRYEAD